MTISESDGLKNVMLDGFTIKEDVAGDNNVVRVGKDLFDDFVKDITVKNHIITANVADANTQSAGVGVEAASNLTVQNNLINQTGTTGAASDGSRYLAGVVTVQSEVNNLDISQNTIETERGVYMSTGVGNDDLDFTGDISNNDFNMGSDSKIGVFVGNEGDVTIDENDFNTVDDISGHIMVAVASKSSTITNNEFNGGSAAAYVAGGETIDDIDAVFNSNGNSFNPNSKIRGNNIVPE